MTSTIIKPTVGRIVWYHPSNVLDSVLARFNTERQVDPMAAQIVGVDTDERVNLVVYDALGTQVVRLGVLLVQKDAPAPAEGGYCYWMPCQTAQAAKQSTADLDVNLLRHQIALNMLANPGAVNSMPGAGAALAKNIQAVQDGLYPISKTDPHAVGVLYPAIKMAMDALATLPPEFNMTVNLAFNHLHRAYWSEVPAPAGAEPLRTQVPVAELHHPV